MKKITFALISMLIFALIFFTQCKPAPKSFRVKFDSSKEVSGTKFAIRDINPDLPRNWDEYNFVVLEYRITTTQRFFVGFPTDYGYNELKIFSYAPNAWNKLAIPLKFYRQPPDARVDLAATYNQPRYTAWINLGGPPRNELHGIDTIGIRMHVPIGNPELEIRNITLTVEDPGDEYLCDIPAMDEFGQQNLLDFPEKIYSLEQLRKEWEYEEKELEKPNPDYNYSRYGGYMQKQVKGTGFFRLEKVDGRWWFVDPDGYLFLSHGVDCVNPEGGPTRDIDKRNGMFKELPPEQFRQNSRGRQTVSFWSWNLYRRFGEDYKEKAYDMTIKRMKFWGLNTIANWSNSAVYSKNQLPHTLQLRGLSMDGSLMGLADVYASGFVARMDSSMKAYLPVNRDNPWVLGYFVGNEPSWLLQETRLCDLILEGQDRPIKTELQNFLKDGNTPERKKAFVYKTFNIFLQTVRTTMKRHDPNHLILGIRFGNLNELDDELLEICRNAFDVLSFNCYSLQPNVEMMDRVLRLTDRPMYVGEYHFGTVDRGHSQALFSVETQENRGVGYRYFTEQAYSHPGMVGTGYFQWFDEDIMGRNDGENYGCGYIDITDRPYKYQVEATMETAKRLYSVHAGDIPPFNQIPGRARGHDETPDYWNE